MDTVIVWVIALLAVGLVERKEKCSELKKKRMDGLLIQCMNVQRPRSLLINKVFSTVCSNGFQTFMVMFRIFFLI